MGMHFKENEEKITLWMIIGGIIIIGILLASLIVYLLNINSSNVNEEYNIGKEIILHNDEADEQFEDVTSEIGKSVNEAMENLNKNSNTQNTNVNNTNTQNENVAKVTETPKEETTEKNAKTEKQEKVETSAKAEKEVKEEENKTEQFISPVKGEVIREFAPDSLVYSETLKEWITHNGIDLKADKGSEVVASCDGKVTSIKNDPRYGLTVIIDHKDGLRTIYANLLSAESVVEGEEVTAGQPIGTVGNSANFEIADDYHLHFEVLKDGDYVDPLTQFTDK